MFFKLVRKWLLDVQNHAIDSRLFVAQTIQNGIDVFRLRNRAIEVSRQPVRVISDSNRTDLG